MKTHTYPCRRSGGAATIIIVCLLAAAAIYFWLSANVGSGRRGPAVQAPVVETPAPEPDATSTGFARYGSAESDAAVAAEHARNVRSNAVVALRARIEAMGAAVRAELDENVPVLQPGDVVELRLTNGVISRGTVVTVAPDGLVLAGEDRTHAIELAALELPMSMRINADLRETWTHHRAAILARADLVTNGYETLRAGTNETEDTAMAASLGDTPSVLRAGLDLLAQSPLPWTDAARGYLMVRAAAQAGDADAQAALGQLILRSTRWGAGPQEGIAWIASAAAAGNGPAQRMLEARGQNAATYERAIRQLQLKEAADRAGYASRMGDVDASSVPTPP